MYSTLQLNVSNPATKEPTIYIGEDKIENELTITLENTLNSVVQIEQASVIKVTPPNLAPPKNLFTSDEINAVTINAGWTIKFTVDGRYRYWKLQSNSNIQLEPNDSITITLSNIVTTNEGCEGSAYNWYFAWQGIQGVSDDTIQRKIFVLEQKPEYQDLILTYQTSIGTSIQVNNDGHYIDTSLIPGLSSDPNIVFVTKPNTSNLLTRFALYLTNQTTKSITFTDQSEFRIYFVADVDGSGTGALTKQADMESISVSQVYSLESEKWGTPTLQGEGDNIYWQIKPGANMVMSKSTNPVKFQIENIYTDLPPYLTPMYIQYNNIPGYKDGVYVIMLEKIVPNPAIATLKVNGQSILGEIAMQNLLQGKPEPVGPLDVTIAEKVSLDWSTINVTECFLDPDRRGNIDVEINGTYDSFIPFRSIPVTDDGLISLETTPRVSIANSIQFNLKPVNVVQFTGNDNKTDITVTDPATSITLSWETQFVSALQVQKNGEDVLVNYNVNDNKNEINKGTFSFPAGYGINEYELICGGYYSPDKGPEKYIVKVTCPNKNPISLAVLPPSTQYPNGAIISHWDLQHFQFDSTKTTVTCSFKNIVLFNHDYSEKYDPAHLEGQVIIPFPDTSRAPTGDYEIKETLEIIYQGKVTDTFTAQVTYELKPKQKLNLESSYYG